MGYLWDDGSYRNYAEVGSDPSTGASWSNTDDGNGGYYTTIYDNSGNIANSGSIVYNSDGSYQILLEYCQY